MNGPLVIKIGGSTLGSTDTTYADIAAMQLNGDIPVVVHGGGAEAGKWLDRLGIPSRFERGLRVTDDEVLPVVVAVFAGLVNKHIVAAINSAGGKAVGISGADARILECVADDGALGNVGHPVAVDASPLESLLSSGLIPVVSPIGFAKGSPSDRLLNVNGDTAAGSIAGALDARELLFLTDVPGVLDGSASVIAEMTAVEARELIEAGVITGGMIPKVEACLHAASLGVTSRILDGRRPSALASKAGTTIRP